MRTFITQFSFYKAEYFILVFSLTVFLKFDCPSHMSVSKGLYSYNGSLTSQNNFYPTFGKWLIESSSKRIRKRNIMKVFVLKYRITGIGIVNFGTFWDFWITIMIVFRFFESLKQLWVLYEDLHFSVQFLQSRIFHIICSCCRFSCLRI